MKKTYFFLAALCCMLFTAASESAVDEVSSYSDSSSALNATKFIRNVTVYDITGTRLE